MRSEREALLDVLDNATHARAFLEGMSVEALEQDRRTFYAVVRCLEIVSEASRYISVATKDRHPGLPWRQVADAGNVYRHRYELVTPERVWLTVAEDLPAIIAFAEAELARSAEA